MKLKISSALAALFLAAATVSLTACSDDDLSKSAPDYDPNYKGTMVKHLCKWFATQRHGHLRPGSGL